MPEKKTRPPLAKIKQGALSRGFALARATVSASTRVASHAVGNLFASQQEKSERFKSLLIDQMGLISRELGQLKGSLMKVGQMLSMYGEHFLPPEANALLKSLQSQSPPLDWKEIEKVLQRQLGPEKLDQLEIETDAMASASLGQVHRARRKADGRMLAMKVQYPGVDQAIEGDLKALKTLLTVSKLIPKGPKYDELFKEVRAMLHQEVDYARELEATDQFRKILEGDLRYIVPETFPELSTKRVLVTSLEEGFPVDSAEVAALPLERRNAIGRAAFELYLKELFELRMMQTDPHFGNYRVRIARSPGEPDQLVLFDFGAVRKFSQEFVGTYREMVAGALFRDRERLCKAAERLGFLLPDDPPELYAIFTELCYLITEPFASSAPYDWGKSDLPKRVARKGAEMVLGFKPHVPPREIVFLDRKMGGIFVFMSVLKADFQGRDLLLKYLGEAASV